jgi:hypothetical protein
MTDIEDRLRRIETTQLVTQDHGARLTTLEKWAETAQTATSGAAIHFKYLVERFDRLDQRLDLGDDRRNKIFIGVCICIIGGIISFIFGGGLAKP